ncbi:MAG: LamG-like jellyroll fold domain-containing protein, partial [Chloroflexota bacterium]
MKQNRTLPIIILTISFLILMLLTPLNLFSAPSGWAEVKTAWEKANDIGVYHYRTDIHQTTRPLPVQANVGLSSRTKQIHLEGQTDRPAEMMQLRLWSNEGNVLHGTDSLEIKVVEGEALGRVGDGEWEAVDNFTDFFAPSGDPMGFLNAATNIRTLSQETRELPSAPGAPVSEISFTRYAFEVDGLTFAEQMRDKMEDQLRQEGKLPMGVKLDTVRHYIDMTGEGEIWIDDNGLPLRQIVRLQFPPNHREQIEAEIKTDFFDWGEPKRLAIAGYEIASPRWLNDGTLQAASLPIGAMGSIFGMIILSVIYLSPKKLYNVAALTVTTSMLVTPLLQATHVEAFYIEQNVRQVEHEREREKHAAIREAEADIHSSDFDPSINPLAEADQQLIIDSSTTQANGNALPAPASLSEDSASIANDAPSTHPQSLIPTLTNIVDSDDDGLPDHLEDAIGSNKNRTDSDGDGLNDGTEAYELGTDVMDKDSDGDGLSDTVEVQGFSANGKQWYLNPLDADTNRDGQPDAVECPTGRNCPDSDNDGTPNVFDYDDDNDGVPDQVDLSITKSIGQHQSFEFRVDSLTRNKLAYVDFQLRPANPDHLWYNLNVLDWPSNDRSGQVQRVSDTTFQTVNDNAGRSSTNNDSHGDMKLVPMLEIEIPFQAGHYGNLPVKTGAPQITPVMPLDQWLNTDELDDFGISVRKKDNAGTLLAYVPLNVVRDTVGDSIVAFSGRMAYRPHSASFGSTQTARLVWLVQALTEVCKPVSESFMTAEEDQEKRRDAWCADNNNWQPSQTDDAGNHVPSIIHTYVDDWSLTGLMVREEQGIDVGVIYENPDFSGRNPAYESNLWFLAQGLDETFMAGRKGVVNLFGRDISASSRRVGRDMTVSTIKTRFDKDTNQAVTAQARWGIPTQALEVKVYNFEDQRGLAELPMTHSQQILNDRFISNGQAKVNTPTLLFAREERFRSANLSMNEEVIQRTGSTYIVNMNYNQVKTQVMASLNWGPYRYKGAGVWEAYSIHDYWAQLDDVYKPIFAADANYFSKVSDVEQLGGVTAAKNYYMSLFRGVNNVVEYGYVPLQQQAVSDQSQSVDYSRADNVASIVLQVNEIYEKIDNAIQSKMLINAYNLGKLDLSSGTLTSANAVLNAIDSGTELSRKEKFFTALGGVANGYRQDLQDGLEDALETLKNPKFAAAAIAGAAAGIGVTVLLTLKNDWAVGEIVGFAQTGIDLVMAIKEVIGAVDALQDAIQAAGGATNFINGLSLNLRLAGNVAGVIVLVLTAVTQVGIFIYNLLSGALQIGSDAFITATINLALMIVVAVVLYAISQIPIVGPLIVAVIALIEAVIQAICKIVGSDNVICGGLISLIIASFVEFFFSSKPVVDMTHKDRMQLANFDIKLKDSALGFGVGNKLNVKVDVTNTLYQQTGSEADVKASNFIYKIQDEFKDDIHQNLSLSGVAWQKNNEGRFEKVFIAEGDVSLEQAGVNREIPPIYLAEGYAIRTIKKVAFIKVAKGTERDTNHIELSRGLKFDIFPKTLDEFYNLVQISASGNDNYGYTFHWDQQTAFPVFADADGDGLRSAAAGGNDPNDSDPDIDDDGLSDFFEIQNGTNPHQADIDKDGLTDYEEVRYGTDANKFDTDNDGLSDKQELDGWQFVYGFNQANTNNETFTTLSTSDPTIPNTDGDSLTDHQEFLYLTNPRSAGSEGGVQSSLRLLNGPYYKPGSLVAYLAKFKSEFTSGTDKLFFKEAFPLKESQLNPSKFERTLSAGQSITVTNAFRVRSDINQSQTTDLVVGDYFQRLLPGESDNNLFETTFAPNLYLALDEVFDTTSFASSYGGFTATCNGNHCPKAGLINSRLGRAVQFDGVDDYIELNGANFGQGDTFTIGFWLRPDHRKASGANNSEKTLLAASGTAFEFYLDRDLNVSAQVGIDNGSSATCQYRTVSAQTALLENQWNHIVLRLTPIPIAELYINGVLQGSEATPKGVSCGGLNTVYLGAAGRPSYAGLMDDVFLYASSPLRADWIKQIYNYQARQFNLNMAHKIVIDADKPTIQLDSDATWYAQRDIVLSIAANDPTSSVDKVEYQINGGAWQDANKDDEAWLFTFNPANGNDHTLNLRATDRVGNVSDITSQVLKIDVTSPTATLGDSLLQNSLSPGIDKKILLFGSVNDTGSGAESCSIELLDLAGIPADDPQSCTINASSWFINFALPPAVELGLYEVRLTLQDAVGNKQVIPFKYIRLDASRPWAEVTQTATRQGIAPPSAGVLPVIKGTASDIALPSNPILSFNFAESAGSTIAHDGSPDKNNATCSGANCPSFGSMQAIFDGANDYLALSSFGDFVQMSVAARIFRDSANKNSRETIISYKEQANCGFVLSLNEDLNNYYPRLWVNVNGIWRFAEEPRTIPQSSETHLAGTYDGQTIRLFRDGLLVASTEAPGQIRQCDMPVGIGARSSLNTHYFFGAIDEIYLYDRPLTSDEIYRIARGYASVTEGVGAGVAQVALSFRNLAGPVFPAPDLVLPFEEPTSFGPVFYDASGNQQKAVCTSCPALTDAGRFGKARQFDGNDNIDVTLNVSESDYSLSLWFKTTCANCGIASIDDGTLGRNGNDRHLYLNGGNICTRVWANETICSTGNNFADNQWHHVAHTYGGNTGGQRIYVDGNVVASGTKTLSNFHWQTGLNIGFSNDATTDYFTGTIDEVQVYAQSLSASQIQHLADPNHWRAATLDSPNEIFTNWSYQYPDTTEGIYDLDLRVTDELGQVRIIPGAWTGDIDTKAPTYSSRIINYPAGNQWIFRDFQAQDYNLPPVVNNLVPLTPDRTIGTLRETTFGANKILQYGAFYFSTPPPTGGSFKICDAYNNCSEIKLAECPIYQQSNLLIRHQCNSVSSQSRLNIAQTNPVTTTLLPSPPLTSLNPVTLSVIAESSDFLQSMTVTANGLPIYSMAWPEGSVILPPGALTETLEAFSWNPTQEGDYTIKATVGDWVGASAESESQILVDVTPPTATLSNTILAGDNFDENGFIDLMGTVSDNLSLNRLEIKINDGDWVVADLPQEGSNTWAANVDSGANSLPNGESYTVTVRATDTAGWTNEVSSVLLADATFPNAVAISLHYIGPGGSTPIQPGDTVYDTLNPTVTLDWTPSTDDSGINRYLVGWTTTPTLTDEAIANLTIYGNNQFSHAEVLADGQPLYAHVVAEDGYGNQTIESIFSPIYIDKAETPTYVNFNEFGIPYAGWLENQCSLMGTDNRINFNTTATSALADRQAFYTTWNADGLTLTWTGANWENDGDLFIYLDTQPGGSTRAYDPYPATQNNTSILLPMTGHQLRQTVSPRAMQRAAQSNQMAADYMIWVQHNPTSETVSLPGADDSTSTDIVTATLMVWDNGQNNWQPATLPWQYHFNADLATPHTNIFLPFTSIGIVNPASTGLNIVAFASEDDGLRLWSTMPSRNPVNSDRVIDINTDNILHRFALTQGYSWPSLGDNICPNIQQ